LPRARLNSRRAKDTKRFYLRIRGPIFGWLIAKKVYAAERLVRTVSGRGRAKMERVEEAETRVGRLWLARPFVCDRLIF
jgi:hypothetical protein